MSAVTTISVALCTHNGAAHLAAQLGSILEGARRPDEIVVSDDASTDDTVAIARHLLADSGIVYRILQNPTALGVTANFEQAVRATTGDLIVLADQDDVWHPDRLTGLEVDLTDGGALLRHSDARLIDGTGAPLGATLFGRLRIRPSDLAAIREGRAFPTYLRRNLATGAATGFRRELLDDALPFPAEWVHDEWLAVLAAARASILVVATPEIDYRLHGANQIGVAEPTLRYRISRVLGESADRTAGLARRATALAERLEARGLSAAARLAREKAAFEARRAQLPRRRIARVPGVLGGLADGGYRRFASQRLWDVVRDLLRPA